MHAVVALVTGSGRRIGRAIVEDLARHGAKVIVHAHSSSEEAEGVAEALRAQDLRAAAITGDLLSVPSAQAVFERACVPFGPPNLLVNNASIFENDSADEPDFDLFDAHMAIHVKAPMVLSAALVKALPDTATGLIVNIVDQRVKALTPRFYSYTLSKAAQWTATQTMAQAFAPRVRVNAIGPGPTLPNSRQSAEDFHRQVSGVLLKRGPSLDEFGATIRYLWQTASVTGQMIALDGGQHLGWETPDSVGFDE
jgi:NAD(P)-dependent dehydrogenase (short-subunit alcohol dehydrogenase family)